MKKLLLFCLSIIFTSNAFAEKYGLIIAVGDYPPKTGWSSISSVNDVPLIKNTLLNQNFKEENITVLINASATRAGILQAIENLKTQIKPGDVVVIHYSGHGQQIFDNNGDEIDDKDESIVPYDALVRYTSNYKGENHIRDDELGNIIANFRNALGQDGQLLMLLDSCHSGSATRGGKARGGEATFAPPEWTPTSNKNTPGSGLVEKINVNKNAAPFVMLSGASADELNYEYEGYGSLSFAFSKAMSDLGSDFTYRKLFASIAANMNSISPNQTPTIEGDTDYKLFKGEYVKQQPYFQISKIARPDMIKINAGKLQRLFEGTTVNILPSGTTKVEENAIISTGTITNSSFNESIITLNTPLKTDNEKDFWLFVDTPSYGDIAVNIYFDESLKSKTAKKAVEKFLNEKKLGTVVKDSLDANLIITEARNTLSVNTTNGLKSIYKQNSSNSDTDYKDLTTSIFNYSQGNYLKNLDFKNYDYEFDFRLLPAKMVSGSNKAEVIEENAFTNQSGTFSVDTSKDVVFLEVTNHSDKPIYFSIIEINSKGEVAPFMPNDNCSLNDNERLVPAGKTMVFKDCYYQFGPPYETLILKGFATPNPINFKPTVSSRGKASGTRGSGKSNPLEGFIGDSFTQTRGSSSNRNTGKVDGYSTEFVYEIVRNKE
jgi:hypothetical protein